MLTHDQAIDVLLRTKGIGDRCGWTLEDVPDGKAWVHRGGYDIGDVLCWGLSDRRIAPLIRELLGACMEWALEKGLVVTIRRYTDKLISVELCDRVSNNAYGEGEDLERAWADAVAKYEGRVGR